MGTAESIESQAILPQACAGAVCCGGLRRKVRSFA